MNKIATFRALHDSGCFVMPNPFDAGSARYLQHLGFRAIASSSAGFAFTRGVADNHATRDAVLAHLGDLVGAVDLPVNADFENGFAHDPEGVAANVKLCVATGVAGLSIEDLRGDGELYDLEHAVARIRAARAAIDAGGSGVLLTARSEVFLTRHAAPLDEAVRRLTAFAAAGADVLFAPGARKLDDLRALVAAVAPRPINVVGAGSGLSVGELAGAGVRRISTAAGLARAAWTGFMRAAGALAEGSLAGFDGLVASGELNALFRGR